MPKKATAKTVGADPESRLDRIARDLSRNLLHGARVQDTSGRIRPSTVVTGQEIAVNLPTNGSDMLFSFAGKGVANVKVPFAQAAAVDTYMADAVTNPRYLTLQADSTIPTWSVQQRQFSFGDLTAPESRVDIAAPATAAVISLPGGAVEEVDTATSPNPDQPGGGSFVTLWQLDAQSGTGDRVPRTTWRPAIMVRFPLTNSTIPGSPDHPDPTTRLFVLKGTPQGDRYFLDQLGLLEGSPRVGVTGIVFTLEKSVPNSAPTRRTISDWTIARTNLSLEARPGDVLKFAAELAPPSLPFIALSSDPSPLDAIRLLQMNSITNSGGYSLRAKSDLDADTLICVILLDAQADPNTDHLESTLLPPAANAVAVPTKSIPQTVRFNGIGHTEFAPFVPPGFVSFGWTRTEPPKLENDPDRFGFGTISMVEFSANDGTGQPIAHADFAVSPAPPLSGDSFDKFQPSGKVAPAATAAMLILASHQVNPAKVIAAPSDVRTLFFRSSLKCFGNAPWERLKDKGRRIITLTPAFRDVFGNRFDATTAPAVTRALFYTDALITPAEWPGVKFGLYASANGLTLEMAYDKQQATDERANRLEQIATQLDGVDGDVKVTLAAAPALLTLVQLPPDQISKRLREWKSNNFANPVLIFPPVPCDGKVTSLTRFQPVVRVERTVQDYLPGDTDLPSDPVLRDRIRSKIEAVEGAVRLLRVGTLPALVEHLTARATTPADQEFRAIARIFQTFLSPVLKAQVAFLRDQVNQHELWFIPDTSFPQPQADGKIVFCTARPLSNKLGTESFTVPDFSKNTIPPGAPSWNGFPLKTDTINDQDFDDLGRVAVGLIEDATAVPSSLTDSANASVLRDLLSARQTTADYLAETGGARPFIVPLLQNPGDIDLSAAGRVARDAFRINLRAFYSVATFLQFPLNAAGTTDILTFEGTFEDAFPSAPKEKKPIICDVLLRGGEKKVTVHYDLPPGIDRSKDAPLIELLSLNIQHVQMHPTDNSGLPSGFKQGAWLELSVPCNLKWNNPGFAIPVAERTFPAKPILKEGAATLPALAVVNGKIPVNKDSAALLVQWGWQFNFGLPGAVTGDIVHITIRYNEKESDTPSTVKALSVGWAPQDLLQALYVLKLLRSFWESDILKQDSVRLPILRDLANFLTGFLAPSAPIAMKSLGAIQPADKFSVTFPQPGIQEEAPAARSVMRGQIDAQWTKDPVTPTLDVATVTAPAAATSAGGAINSAFLLGGLAVRNFRVNLLLTRNEKFLSAPANPVLIYQCAPVDSPHEYRAVNLWAPPQPPLAFEGAKLADAILQFFTAVLNGASMPNDAGAEVGIFFTWSRGKLDAVTPVAVIAGDQVAGSGVAELAAAVVGICNGVIPSGAALADLSSPAIRLRVKLTTNSDIPDVRRSLLDIVAIDFPLFATAAPRTEKHPPGHHSGPKKDKRSGKSATKSRAKRSGRS